MTKAFLHGRTEAIRTVQPYSVAFTKVCGSFAWKLSFSTSPKCWANFFFDSRLCFKIFFSDQSTPQQKISALRRACDGHVKLTKECSRGLGQDRHLYALYCLLQREMKSFSPPELDGAGSPPSSPRQQGSSNSLPAIFTDPGWTLLNTSILSTSNCGNPALRLFGFGPVAADGFGFGYIIKDDGLSVCVLRLFSISRRWLSKRLDGIHIVHIHSVSIIAKSYPIAVPLRNIFRHGGIWTRYKAIFKMYSVSSYRFTDRLTNTHLHSWTTLEPCG